MEKKKVKLFSALALVALALLVVGATYAYFQSQYGASSQTDVKVTTYTTDLLTFETGDAINISADQETFAQGKGNQTGSTFARATLQANNKTNTATANYYMYLNIETNTFTYINTGTPELILQVVDKTSGKPVTSITGLDYVTVTDGKNTSISGFDITNKSGLITILNNKEISASPKTIEEYTITITFINHNYDQNINTGKSFNSKVIIQKERLITSVSDVAKSGDNLVTALETLGAKGNSSLTGLYHHDASLTNGAGDNSYRFAGENPNNYVCFGSDDATCPTENLYRIIGVIDGKVKLIHAYGATTDMLGTDEGYVNTYQEALGDSLKLAQSFYKGKEDFAKIGTYKWNKTVDNTWSTSTTNTINLNINYLTYLDGKNTKWKTMIADTTWYVGGMTWSNGVESNAKTAYNYEVGANKDTPPSPVNATPSYDYEVGAKKVVTPSLLNATPSYDYEVKLINTTPPLTSKIGLMYVSEYYYGATPDYWTLPGIDENGHSNEDKTAWIGEDYSKAINDNWMSTGLYEWTISRNSGGSDDAFGVLGFGYVVGGDVGNSLGLVARPSFSLSSSIKFTSGEGTAVNPIRINL